ncbi:MULTISPECIES: glycosyltransferase family 2 protein [unclassified Fibrobacter]|uniref:glycosyltransferase family 2 protein n=1 Tax=unclassified Fibrobacter TaxID=2634177 RepID=UPI000911EB7E|nr:MULTISPECIES: glycosyltransferase family 2 protein [unclassified Fibrobacter]OWV05269.1 hypothetical protein B7993_08310 [Fibrobacter sp. UWH3]SHL30987.1 Glycosyltransferase involved in cell wall bisynthesis [Fibrobacter sp. UWH6]
MSDVTPLISIIIPAFNASSYIKECFDHILTQSFLDYEVVVVDDGSADETPEICDSYALKSSKIKVIHKENEGASSARATAVHAARGKYLVFVDADDWIVENSLSKIATSIRTYQPDIICWGMIRETPKGLFYKSVSCAPGLYSKEQIEKSIYPNLIQGVRGNYFSPSLWGKSFRRELFLQNMLSNTNAVFGEDFACSIACIYNSESLFIMSDCLYFYRYNTSSVTRCRKAYNWSCPEVLDSHIKSRVDIDYGDFRQQSYRKIVHDIFTVAVSRFYEKKNFFVFSQDLRFNLNHPLYREAIEKAFFKNSLKAKFMLFVLKRRLYWLIGIYAMIK